MVSSLAPAELERMRLLYNDPLIYEMAVDVKSPETISRFLKNFDYRTTHQLRNVNFRVFNHMLSKSRLLKITIDIDSSVINVEGHQEGAAKGYNPKKKGNNCYNIQFAFCDELKAYISGIYKCTKCNKNEVVHSQGEPFAPCGVCGSNNSWKLVKKTK